MTASITANGSSCTPASTSRCQAQVVLRCGCAACRDQRIDGQDRHASATILRCSPARCRRHAWIQVESVPWETSERRLAGTLPNWRSRHAPQQVATGQLAVDGRGDGRPTPATVVRTGQRQRCSGRHSRRHADGFLVPPRARMWPCVSPSLPTRPPTGQPTSARRSTASATTRQWSPMPSSRPSPVRRSELRHPPRADVRPRRGPSACDRPRAHPDPDDRRAHRRAPPGRPAAAAVRLDDDRGRPGRAGRQRLGDADGGQPGAASPSPARPT